MRWPVGLAEQVEKVAGPRGRSGFVVAAVQAALNGAAVPAVVETPASEASSATVRHACGHFTTRPGNALRCFHCGERLRDHR